MLVLKNIKKEYKTGDTVVHALKGISIGFRANEFVSILGPSGCGKTTLLRILGGFLEADEGNIIFNGEEISNKPPYERELNTVFQKYALFPHLNVYENIAFPLRLKKKSEEENKTAKENNEKAEEEE